MEVLYPRCAGLDIHKESVVACIRIASGGEVVTEVDVSPILATTKADTKKIKHYKPKVLARQPNNYGYGRALGYADQFGYA